MSYTRKSKKRIPRKIFIFTEGSKTEPKYFREFIQYYKISQAKVKVIDRQTTASSPKSVINDMISYVQENKIYDTITTKNDIYCLVIDTDKWGLNLIDGVNEAHQRKYLVALSNPCFEIWLLMHFQDADTILNNANLLKTKGDINTQIHSYHITGKNEIDYFPRTNSAVKTAGILDIAPQQRLLQQIGSRVYLLMEILQEYI